MTKATAPRVTITINGEVFTFTARSLDGFPEARSMLAYLLARGSLSRVNAVHYVVLAARLKRLGRLNHPEVLTRRVEATAANAYWRWCGETYGTRVRPVLDALKNDDVQFGYRWLRRGSLVPAFEGKKIQWRMLPVPPKPGESKMPPAIAEEPCSIWTLHVPRKATTPVHIDPCPDCACIKLTMEQVEVIAAAFENAWGHRNLDAVPAECFLFGPPPIDRKGYTLQMAASERVVALVPDGALSMALDQLEAGVTRDSVLFVDRARVGNVAAVAIDFRAVKVDQIDAVLGAVREAAFRWHEAHPPVEAAPLAPPLPTNNAPLPGVATTVYGESVHEVAPEVTTEFPVALPPIAPPPAPSSLADWAAVILGEAPIASPLETPPVPPPVEPETQFTDWAAISSAVKTRLVQCSVHKKPHSVTTGQVECGPNAWVEIPQ